MKHVLGVLLAVSMMVIGANAFAVTVKIGDNAMTCSNENFGSFEIKFNVKDNVILRQPSQDDPSDTSWEYLENKLNELTFTSGKMLEPTGVRGVISGAELSVSRYAVEGPRKGKIWMALSIHGGVLPLETLFVDDTHPDEYGTDELGAQTYVQLPNDRMAQMYFQCQ